MASAGPSLLAEPAPLTGRKLFFAGFAIALANFIVVLDITIANVSVPHIAGGLAISPTQGTWVITSYAVADAISVPLSGWLAARFGVVRLFIMALIGFGAFSILCGLSSSLGMLVIFRICQGFSGGPLMPLSQTLLMRVFSRQRAPLATAVWAMTTVSAPIAGPILGGWISDGWSWPWIFFINVPVVLFCIFMALRMLKPFETATARPPIDRVGLLLLITWVAAFQIMLDTGRENDWFGSPFVVAMAIIAAIGFAAFIIWELTAANPVVDIRVFRFRSFAAGTAAVGIGYGAFFVSIVMTPLWLQQVVGYNATNAGYATALAGVFAVMISPVAARLSGLTDVRRLACFGVVWMGAVSIMRTEWTIDADFWTYALPQLLQGIGMPFFFIGMTALAMSGVATSEITSAAGIMAFVRTLSGAVGTALATTAWDSSTRVSRVDMVSRLNDPAGEMAKMQSSGMTLEQARAAVDRMVEVQASTIGASHVYLYAAVALAVSAAIVWIAPRPTGFVDTSGGH
jgi:MFS transporter, DHA2 family, multidrug resistance protein